MTKKHNISLTAVETLSKETLDALAKDRQLSEMTFDTLRDSLGEQITTLIKDVPMGDLVDKEETPYGTKYTLKVEVTSGLDYEGCVNNIRQSGK